MARAITHEDAVDALRREGLEELLAHSWADDYRDGCNTAWMLADGFRCRLALEGAIDRLKAGLAPTGATPWPSAAAWLLSRRREGREETKPCH